MINIIIIIIIINRTSHVATYRRMFNNMESRKPSVYVSSTMDGVQRVLDEGGHYAFLMESTTIDYLTERQCDLMQIGGTLDTKGYGIALPKGEIDRRKGGGGNFPQFPHNLYSAFNN